MPATLDYDARYAVGTFPGVAFYLTGPEVETKFAEPALDCESDDCPHDLPYCWLFDEDGEPVETGMVKAVMVGDDREHLVDPEDLTVIEPEAYCGGCGQIGCGADGR